MESRGPGLGRESRGERLGGRCHGRMLQEAFPSSATSSLQIFPELIFAKQCCV